MPWPIRCAVCRSRDIQAGADEVTCLACGRLTDMHGVAVPLSEQYQSDDVHKEQLAAAQADLIAKLQSQLDAKEK